MKFSSIGCCLVLLVLVSLLSVAGSGKESETLSRIHGKVTEYNGTRAAGQPVPGAEVYIEQEPPKRPLSFLNETETDPDGQFEVFRKPGDYRITVTAEGYKKHAEVISVPAGEDLEVNIELITGTDNYDVDLDVSTEATLQPGGSTVLSFEVENTGDTGDYYNVSVEGDELSWISLGKIRSAANGGPYSQSVSLMEDNRAANLDINITVPEDTDPGNYTFTIKARSLWDPDTTDEEILVIRVDPGEEDEDAIPFVGLFPVVVTLIPALFVRKRFTGR